MASYEDVRHRALGLPETTEAPWFGTRGFKVRGQGFLRMRDRDEGGLVVFVADMGERDMLLATSPKKFFTTPHYDAAAIVLVNLKAIGVRELGELITESWYQKAPPALRKAFDLDFDLDLDR